MNKPEVVCDYMKTQPCMQLTVLQTNLLQVESANVNLRVNWSKLVDLLNICLWNNIPNLCEYGKFNPASSVFSLAWLLAFTKSFGWLVCHVVGLFTCKQTSAHRVVKFYCHHDLRSLRIYMWKLMWNPRWSVCENKLCVKY